MNNHRGFTVIEMIIGGAILLIITMIALSFFIFQSRHGGQLMKDTAVRENVSSALTMIKRDLMHAGSGLDTQPELSIWLGGLLSGSFRELYLSYGGYLSPMAPPDGGISDYTSPNNVYSVYGSGAVFNGTVSPYVFTIAALPKDIYGVIVSDAPETDSGHSGPSTPGTQTFQPYKGDPAWPSGYATDSFTPKYKFTADAPSGMASAKYTPAIAYRLVTSTTTIGTGPGQEKGVADAQFPELRRNGVTILGGGRDKTLKITPPGDATNPAGGFRIRALFIDNATTTETWVPITGTSTPFPQGQTFTNLRMVEVQISYRTLKRNYAISGAGRQEAWTQEVTKTMSISPRELVVAGFQ